MTANICQAASDYMSPTVDHSRRKVIQYVYWSASDTSDSKGGHGSHTAGTLVGYPSSGSNNYQGVASGAKLAFFDATPGSKNYLEMPSIYEYVFPISHLVGAYVHSNSWYVLYTSQ